MVTFLIPKEDLKGALFKAEDKSIFFMHWMKKHLEFFESSMKQEGLQ